MVQDSSATLTVQSRVAKETSPFTFQTYQIDAITLAGWLSAWASFKTTFAAICAGNIRHEQVRIYDIDINTTIPTDNYARREIKLLFRYHGVTLGEKFTLELPCPKLDVLTMETGDANFVVLADAGPMAAFIIDFENMAKSPKDTTEDVVVDSVQVVGRNI